MSITESYFGLLHLVSHEGKLTELQFDEELREEKGETQAVYLCCGDTLESHCLGLEKSPAFSPWYFRG